MGRIAQIRLGLRALETLPYKRAWTLLFLTMFLFSWPVELTLWAMAFTVSWRYLVLFYTLEFGVIIPLTIYVTKKTMQKLYVTFSMRQTVKNLFKNLALITLWNKVRKWI